MSTDEGSVSVIDSFTDLMDSLDKRETVNRPSDVEELIPEKARLKNGELIVFDSVASNEDTSGFTPLRKKIIRVSKENPEKIQGEIASLVGCSGAEVSRTSRNFDFLLENDSLYKAFVSPRFKIKEEEVEYEETPQETGDSNSPVFTQDEKYTIVKSLILNENQEVAKKVLSTLN